MWRWGKVYADANQIAICECRGGLRDKILREVHHCATWQAGKWGHRGRNEGPREGDRWLQGSLWLDASRVSMRTRILRRLRVCSWATAMGRVRRATARSYQTFLGTIGRDVSTGLDSIYLNAAFPERMPFLVSHEYFHVVQMHLGGAGEGPQSVFPTWFLEGMEDWEALKSQDPPFPNWLAVVRTEQRAGRSPALASLMNWEQWRDTARQDRRS